MIAIDVEGTGERLATARKQRALVGGVAGDLGAIGSLGGAEAVQAAAALALDQTRIGWSLAATSDVTRRLLGCTEPVAGPLFAEDTYMSGSSLALRSSMLGIGAQFAFTFGRSYPMEDETVGLESVADAVVSCRLALQILSRRVPDTVPLNTWVATADFGLSDAFVTGTSVEEWRFRALGDTDIRLLVDGHACAWGRGRDTLGDPLAPLLWLAERLAGRGQVIDAGDVVATGTCTGLVQLTPGRHVSGQFAGLGEVDLLTT